MRREVSEGIKFVKSGGVLAIVDTSGTRLRFRSPVVSSISVEEFEMERNSCLAVDLGRCGSHTDLKCYKGLRDVMGAFSFVGNVCEAPAQIELRGEGSPRF